MLHTIDEGAGDPVLLLPSSGMSSRQWKRLISTLSTTYRVIAPDLLGSGANTPWPLDKPFHFHDDVRAVGELLGDLPPVHVVGHSYGGLVGLTYARLHPDRVRSLALYEPVAMGVLYAAHDKAGLTNLSEAAIAVPKDHPEFGGSEPWLEAFIGYWNGPGAWAALPKVARDEFLRVGRKVFLEVESLLADRTATRDYLHVFAPSLLMCGEQSPLAARDVVRILDETLPNSTLHEIKGAGHMGPLSHAAEVNQLIVNHLAGA